MVMGAPVHNYHAAARIRGETTKDFERSGASGEAGTALFIIKGIVGTSPSRFSGVRHQAVTNTR